MKIDLSLQFEADQTLPTMPVKVLSGSALALELYGIPPRHAGGALTGVSVSLTNADGEPVTAPCGTVDAAHCAVWAVLFSGTNFANYGYVKKGFRVVATYKRADDSTAAVDVCGDLEIKASSATATPGSPSSAYQVSGGDVYFKSVVVDGVQHYVKQSVVYNALVGWGAEWGGDYIKTADGRFIEYTEG